MPWCFFIINIFFRRRYPKRNCKNKCWTDTLFAADFNSSVHLLHQAFYNGHAKSRSLIIAAGIRPFLCKRLKHLLHDQDCYLYVLDYSDQNCIYTHHHLPIQVNLTILRIYFYLVYLSPHQYKLYISIFITSKNFDRL